MRDPKPPELTLFVRSERRRPSEGAVGSSAEAPKDGLDVDLLPESHARALASARASAARRGFTLKVVDLGRSGRLGRLIAERAPAGARLPILLGPGELRVEGPEAFSELELAGAMPAELPARRAYTYLKVRGGDVERLRAALVEFPEVRELHFLTGDWDLLAVLEFPAADHPPRQILEFVTHKIRSIPEVLDTSTLVPELTVTKLPF